MQRRVSIVPLGDYSPHTSVYSSLTEPRLEEMTYALILPKYISKEQNYFYLIDIFN